MEKQLLDMLEKIVNRSVVCGVDSCEQKMSTVRTALIDQARELIDQVKKEKM